MAATIIIVILLVVAIFFALRYMKKHKDECNGNCAGCKSACHSKK